MDGGGLPLVADVFSSSFDEQHAPTNVLTNEHNTRWVSSGLFPQFLRLILREPLRLASIEVTCRHVARLEVRAARSKSVVRDKMALVGSLDVPAGNRDKLDTHQFALESEDAAELEAVELRIESGFNDFAVVYFVRLRPDAPSATQVAS